MSWTHFRKHGQTEPYANRARNTTTVSRAVYQWDDGCSSFLAADQWTDAYCFFCKPFSCKASMSQNSRAPRTIVPDGSSEQVDSKTRTYHGRDGAGRRTACRGGAGREGAGRDPDGSARLGDTRPSCLQGIEDSCPKNLFGSTNKQNPMYTG